ncbi:FecR protein [Pigmentiphaga humi]|uniref:FecR protein n=1 Tax=Pigmentiphaga humi TaxID=2478468 RepID=A0A3P4B049_9BURK|nr:FecR domain-containing protein [Pigmentiphaga humi]VCU69673.1 FecR protein [Pigmentiphaga humi]
MNDYERAGPARDEKRPRTPWGVFIKPGLFAALGCLLAIASSAGAQPVGEPLRHEVRTGDTLYDLAQAYLEDPGQWPELARANGNPRPNRLRPGSIVLVPDALLRRKPGGARIVHVSGEVRYATRGGASGVLETGMKLIDGDRVETGSGGFATLEMADGSVVRITGDSVLRLDRVKYSLVKKRADTALSLDKGRVESSVAPQRASGSRFQVGTPLMAAGVRGTEFGVSVAGGNRATSDVLEGEVELQVGRSGNTARVLAGSGGAVAAGDTVPALAPLLAAPDLSGAPALQQRPLIDLPFPALAGAASYRAFIWPAQAPGGVVGNVVAEGPRVRFAGLEDGDYVVRVNAIDALGIEGRPAVLPIRLKARPEPPVTLAPPDAGTIEAGEATLRWTQAEGIASYRLQVARDQAFTDLIVDEAAQQGESRTLPGLSSGTYFWRIGSVAAGKDGRPDAGPFGDPRRFMVRLPVAGSLGMAQDGDQAVLSWDGEEGQQYLVQIARAADFSTIVAEQRTAQRQWALDGLPGGQYFVRIQATDGDGYVRDFTRAQQFRIYRFVRSGSGPLRMGDGQEIQLQ